MRMRCAARQSAGRPARARGVRRHCDYANFVVPGNKKHQAPKVREFNNFFIHKPSEKYRKHASPNQWVIAPMNYP